MIFQSRRKYRRIKNLTLLFLEQRVNLFLNPKVGTSTVKNVCLANLKPGLHEDTSKLNIHDEVRALTNHGSNYSTREFLRQMNAPDCRNFIFVRNPYTRLVSAWLDKIVDPKRGSRLFTDNREVILKFARKHNLPAHDSEGRVPFDTFVQWILKTPNVKLNIHWAVQSELAMCHKIHYSDVYRIETNFSDGLQSLMRALNFDENIFERKMLPKNLNAGRLKPSGNHFTEALAEAVYKKFRSDFDSFGYDPNSWR